MNSLLWPEDLSHLCLSPRDSAARVRTVSSHLGCVLNTGYLALFIGAGVSAVVRLPMWGALNSRILEAAPAVLKEMFPGLWSSFENDLQKLGEFGDRGSDPLGILDRIERICSSCETLHETGSADPNRFVGNAPSWHRIVKRALYKDMVKYGFEQMFDPELVSLCSLLQGGIRGCAREVVTFNYDDLIESFLHLHGHPYCAVTPLPTVLTPNHGTTVYHPHGYLPLQDASPHEPPFLVLSKQSYDKMQSGRQSHWEDFIAWVLTVRIGLFIGMSGRDPAFTRYFRKAQELAGGLRGGRPLAFAVLLGDDNLPRDEWLDSRIIPLEFEDSTAVAEFLALVCQYAAAQARPMR